MHRKRPNTLGFIPWQLVVGAVDIGVQSGLTKASYDSTKKYAKRTTSLARQSQQAAEASKDQEIALRRRVAEHQAYTSSLLTDKTAKLATLGVIVTLIVSLIGLGVFYSISTKGGK